MVRLNFLLLPVLALLILSAAIIIVPGTVAFGTLKEERVESRKLLDDLGAREKELVMDLAALDLKIYLGRKKLSELENVISKVSLERDAALRDSQLARSSAEGSLKKIHSWLNIRYRYGYTSYVGLLLDSRDFFDFLNRGYFITTMITREARVYRDVTRKFEAAREKEKQLGEAREKLSRQEKLLAEQTAELEKAALGRSRMLAQVRLESARLADLLTGIEKNWVKSLDLFGYTMSALENINWLSVYPEKISFVPGGLQVDMSQSAINKAFSSSSDENLKNFTLSFNQDGMTIDLRSRQDSPALLLQGQLSAAGGKELIFSPRTLILDGLPVDSAVFQELGTRINIPVLQLPMMESHTIKSVATYGGGVRVILAGPPD